eukprot:sb/3465502/
MPGTSKQPIRTRYLGHVTPVQEPTETSKQLIRTRYLGHVTGYPPIRDQYFLIRSVPGYSTVVTLGTFELLFLGVCSFVLFKMFPLISTVTTIQTLVCSHTLVNIPDVTAKTLSISISLITLRALVDLVWFNSTTLFPFYRPTLVVEEFSFSDTLSDLSNCNRSSVERVNRRGKCPPCRILSRAHPNFGREVRRQGGRVPNRSPTHVRFLSADLSDLTVDSTDGIYQRLFIGSKALISNKLTNDNPWFDKRSCKDTKPSSRYFRLGNLYKAWNWELFWIFSAHSSNYLFFAFIFPSYSRDRDTGHVTGYPPIRDQYFLIRSVLGYSTVVTLGTFELLFLGVCSFVLFKMFPLISTVTTIQTLHISYHIEGTGGPCLVQLHDSVSVLPSYTGG